MINKFQQGGAAPQQSGSILQQIQQLPQEQQQQLMQAFAQWAQQKGVDIQQLQQNPQALEQALGQFMQEMQTQQAQMARHGAKLQYIKNLKHQCGPDEELVYFKAGGQIGCNCVKKNKAGGKADTKKSALQQFKDKKKKVQLEKDCGGAKMKKHQIGGTLETLRQSLGLEKITKAQEGLKFGGSNKANRFISQPTVLPEVTVKGNRPYRFDRRVSDKGNGYKMISDVMYDEYNDNGEYWGDLAGVMGGRVIYQTPFGNDTIYGGRQASYLKDPQRYTYESFDGGWMNVPMNRNNQAANRANFYNMIKKSHVSPYSEPQEKQAFQRAKRGN